MSSGAKAMLEEMGAEFVKAEKLAKLAERRGELILAMDLIGQD